jgi:hypothetical protein
MDVDAVADEQLQSSTTHYFCFGVSALVADGGQEDGK